MDGNYLIHGTNALRDSLQYSDLERFAYEKRSVHIYLSVACTTLSYLLEDSESLQRIADGMNGNAADLYHQFGDFIEEFVRPDQALLIAAGMDERMARYLFQDLGELQERLRAEAIERRDVSADHVKARVHELQYNVCQERDSFMVGRSPLWRAVKVIGGAAVITTNAMGDAIIGGLASAFSQSFGGYVVGKGFDG